MPETAKGQPKGSREKASAAAEEVEGRRSTKGNVQQAVTPRTQGRPGVSIGLLGVRAAARRDKRTRFTALLHHVNQDLLRDSFYKLKKQAAPGVDGVTWREYEVGLEERLRVLCDRVHRGSYRALPSRRTYIPKPDGRQRPLGIAAVEDKVVQQALVTVLNQIYEVDFEGYSYGSRPGRSPHQALDALWVGVMRKKVNWVLDADIRGFFDAISHGWLLKFLEHRIADRRVLRLVRKWLRAGVLEEGRRSVTDVGTPQGAVISPLLANIYLHYVLDTWTKQWRQRSAQGDVIIVRYVDDVVLGFQHRVEAERYHRELIERLGKFGLELHPEKTRLVEFGRFAIPNRRKRGAGRPETFNFLGFTHICAVRRNGKFTVKRKTMAKRLSSKLKGIRVELKRRRHEPVPQLGKWLGSVVRGFLNYHAVPDNWEPIAEFRKQVRRSWLDALRRRSQRTRLTWARFAALADLWLPPVRILHPMPYERFDARHPR